MDKRKGQPKEEQTTQWTKEKDNRRRNRQHNGQKKRTTEGGTDNTMDKRKGQPMFHRKLHRKRTIESTNPTSTGDEPRYSRKINSSCSTSVTRCGTHVDNLVISHEREEGRGS
jgi:hypothetical protein